MEHRKQNQLNELKSPDQDDPKGNPKTEISRRNFLNGVGAVGAAFVSQAALASPLYPDPELAWKHEADIVVVGTGAAGSSAALNAHRLGNRVLMVEKAATYGGTTAKSGDAIYWIPNNSVMRKQGLQDSREDALRYMVRLSYPHLYNPADPHLGILADQYEVLAAFYDNAAPAIDALEAMTTIRSNVVVTAVDSKPWVDYRADLAEDKAIRGRALGTTSSQGGGHKPEDHLIAHIKRAIERQGISVLFQHRAGRLLLNTKGEVVGLEVKTPEGDTAAIRARKAVIFGSGGFAHNRELRQTFLRGPIFGACTVATNEGDFIYIATAAGASLANMGNAWWTENVFEVAVDPSNTPMDISILRGDSLIEVNRYGKRIVNEQIDYNDRGQVHFIWDPARAEYSNLLTFMIYDQRTADRYAGRYPIPARGASASYVLSGQSLGELARAIEARLEKFAPYTGNFKLDPGFAKLLEQTIARFNVFAGRGIDEEFHRGETPYEVARFLPEDVADKTKRNPSMFPITAAGPYYAIIIAGGCLDTHGGPKINARAQVVDTNGKPIPGLYGAGNCIGFAGQGYWGLGSTIGPALTFGYIAARGANQEGPKDL
jgi:3-oxosteroid 1-dehydrogenase